MQMEEIVFDGYGLVVSRDDETWFLLYNAGGRGVQMRKDVISLEDALRVMAGPPDATKALLDLQRRSATLG
jgi:hypothetical protein